MDNKHPKSEMPALKEAATASKNKEGLQKSVDKEQKPRQHQHDAPPGDHRGGSRSK